MIEPEALCPACRHPLHPPGDGLNGGCQADWVEPDGWRMVCGCREDAEWLYGWRKEQAADRLNNSQEED